MIVKIIDDYRHLEDGILNFKVHLFAEGEAAWFSFLSLKLVAKHP
jgi:hypothetical protein